MSTNNIGIQIIGDNYDPAMLINPNGGKPRVTKLVDCSLSYYQRVRAVVGPMGLVVIRWVTENQPLDNPVQNARDWFELRRAFFCTPAKIHDNPQVEYWFGVIRDVMSKWAVYTA
jgi:hypothetical protein